MIKATTFNLQHRADLRPNTSSYDLAESCVFSKQALPSFRYVFLGNQEKTLFIPKLQS